MSATSEQKQELENEVDRFLKTNFPQIQMHGGEITITEVDVADQHVAINLSGACSGCGISPQTVQAVKTRLPKKVDGVTTVDVDTEELTKDDITEGPF